MTNAKDEVSKAEAIKPWEDRAEENASGYANHPYYMQQEINDLRAALQSAITMKNSADQIDNFKDHQHQSLKSYIANERAEAASLIDLLKVQVEELQSRACAAGQPSALNGIPATHKHDEGAIARCSCCLRYSLDKATLSDRQPICDCGKQYGWSGSFVKPDTNSKWSGKAPSAPVPPTECAPAAWKYRALAGNGEWRVTLKQEWARSINGDIDVIPLYELPVLPTAASDHIPDATKMVAPSTHDDDVSINRENANTSSSSSMDLWDGWLPIETAPEKKSVIVCVSDIHKHRLVIASKNNFGMWLNEIGMPMPYLPSHWMHLPARPADPLPRKEQDL